MKMERSYSSEVPKVPKYTKRITRIIKNSEKLTINMQARYSPRLDVQDLEKIKIEFSQGSEVKNMPEYRETILKSQKTSKIDQKGQNIIPGRVLTKIKHARPMKDGDRALPRLRSQKSA